jgi:tetratricopeptide (TPR) repeat protein
MRVLFALTAFLSTASALDQTYRPGDVVVGITTVPLKVENREVITTFAGEHFKVGKLNGNWLWVTGRKAGWIEKKNVIPHSHATDYFTALINRDPSKPTYRYARAVAWLHGEEFQSALTDLSELIRLNPTASAYWHARGQVYAAMKQYANAISDYDESIRLEPQALTFRNRGWARLHYGESQGGISDYREAIRLDPAFHSPFNGLAWLYATSSDESVRNGISAIQYAKRACELTGWHDANDLDTLAAAYAEDGKFDEAIKWQQKAIELAEASEISKFSSRLELYKQGKPYPEPLGSAIAPSFELPR